MSVNRDCCEYLEDLLLVTFVFLWANITPNLMHYLDASVPCPDA
jgi:hypothetical protein